MGLRDANFYDFLYLPFDYYVISAHSTNAASNTAKLQANGFYPSFQNSSTHIKKTQTDSVGSFPWLLSRFPQLVTWNYKLSVLLHIQIQIYSIWCDFISMLIASESQRAHCTHYANLFQLLKIRVSLHLLIKWMHSRDHRVRCFCIKPFCL